MKHYPMAYREALSLPIRTFWHLNASIGRIEAESNLRLLEVIAASKRNESYEDMRDALVKEMGTLMKQEEEISLDVDGLNELRKML